MSAFGFRGTKKSMPFTAQTTAENAIRMLIDQVMKETKIMISGLGLGRDTTLRAIWRSGVILNFVCDVTAIPHNGYKPP